MSKPNLPKLAFLSTFALAMTLSSFAFGESAGQYVDDATITTKVKAALLSDQQLKATQVSVTTSQGVVQLSGTVSSKDQESQAIRDANKIKGVQSVQDQLQVRGMQDQ
jgi:hyperosmotically inducible protein